MKRSTDRILTTHAGSLPRPPDLTRMMWDLLDEKPVDQDKLATRVQEAVVEVVGKQREAGIDIVSDGEMSKVGFSNYVMQRYSGFANRAQFVATDLGDFPGHHQQAVRRERGRPPSRHAQRRGTDRAARQGRGAARHRQLQGGARRRHRRTTAFIAAVTPGQMLFNFPNLYYPSDAAYLEAAAKALSYEYKAIVDAGFNLQLDAPDLPMRAHCFTGGVGTADMKTYVPMAIEAMNEATRGLPPDKVRLHLCWGNYAGPHHHDVELKEIIEPVLKTNAGFIYFEAANPRHAHEWEVWEQVKIPDGKALIPGVIDTLTNHVEHPRLVAQRIETFAAHRRQGERDRRHRLRLRHLRRLVGLRPEGGVAQAQGAGGWRRDRLGAALEIAHPVAVTSLATKRIAWEGHAMSAESAHEYPVLIAGGGLVGLSAAMFLAQHNVSSLAIERLSGASQLPRAAFFHMRTIELFRAAGIEAEVREQSLKEFMPEGAIVLMDTLAGKQLAAFIPSLNEGVDALSPCRRLFVTQPGLEPILRRRAEMAGARVLDGHEVIGVEQDADGVTVTAREESSGREIRLRAKYLIGADGAHSKVRDLLGIEFDGRGVFSNSMTIYFRAEPRALAAEQAAERDLHRQSGAGRFLPHGQGLPVRVPVREHGRRSQAESGRCVECVGRRQRAAADRLRARRRRRSQSAGQDRRHCALARDLRCGAPLPGRPRVPCRRRRPSDAAERRLRRQHRNPRRT